MKPWLDQLQKLDRDCLPHVLVTIVRVEGSAPRETGTRMVVQSRSQHGTIGGGNLEYQALKIARELLQQPRNQIEQMTFTLGQDLSQCCGGQVTLMFESFVERPLRIMLFGAGHIGSALVDILSQLQCEVSWFDSRAEFLPQNPAANIHTRIINQPTLEVECCPGNACYLIMTHSHEQDFEIIEAVLARQDVNYCGLIASKSKAARFRQRLRRKGFSDAELSRLTAPLGLPGITAREPMAVAVAIAAELLQLHHREASQREQNTDATLVI